jgi:hypothetical protein
MQDTMTVTQELLAAATASANKAGCLSATQWPHMAGWLASKAASLIAENGRLQGRNAEMTARLLAEITAPEEFAPAYEGYEEQGGGR